MGLITNTLFCTIIKNHKITKKMRKTNSQFFEESKIITASSHQIIELKNRKKAYEDLVNSLKTMRQMVVEREEFYGLCQINRIMRLNGASFVEWVLLSEFIKFFRPRRMQEERCIGMYYWPKGRKAVRIRWIDARIKQLEKDIANEEQIEAIKNRKSNRS